MYARSLFSCARSDGSTVLAVPPALLDILHLRPGPRSVSRFKAVCWSWSHGRGRAIICLIPPRDTGRRAVVRS